MRLIDRRGAVPCTWILLSAALAGVTPARAQTTTSTSLATSTTLTTIPPVLKCKDRLLKRARQLDKRLTRCAVKARRRARAGRTFDEAACIASARAKYDGATTNPKKFSPTRCPACVLDTDQRVRESVGERLVQLRADLEPMLVCDQGVSIAERLRCETKILKAVDRLQAGRMRCRRDAARVQHEGGVPNERGCISDADRTYDEKTEGLSCPECVNAAGIRTTVTQETDAVIELAHCPCRFGGSSPCPVCQECDVSMGCIPGSSGAGCGSDDCLPSTCLNGTCTAGDPRDCDDSNVCTLDSCVDEGGCVGAECCVNEPIVCPVDGEGAECVINAECAPLAGCVYVCEPGCPFVGCP